MFRTRTLSFLNLKAKKANFSPLQPFEPRNYFRIHLFARGQVVQRRASSLGCGHRPGRGDAADGGRLRRLPLRQNQEGPVRQR